MDKICPKCAADPLSHSFKKVSEKGGVSLFYSHPSMSKLYDDTEGILSHVDKMLIANGNKKWSCVIDGDGFDIKHALEVRTGVGLMQLLIEKYGKTMAEFKIINPTWHINGMLKLAAATLPPDTFAKVKVLDDRKRSILEFM
jgi:hypothetical protein